MNRWAKLVLIGSGAALIHLLGNGVFCSLAVGQIYEGMSDGPHAPINKEEPLGFKVWNFGFVAAKSIYEKSHPDPGPPPGQTWRATPELLRKIAAHDKALSVLFSIWTIAVGVTVAGAFELFLVIIRNLTRKETYPIKGSV